MHLARMLDLRPVPAAGAAIAVTRRCPLGCRHCSTASLPRSEQYPDEPFRRFVASFGASRPPKALLLTGGEPLLRPRLVADLAREARRVGGTASCLVTGMFFATPDGLVPDAIDRALRSVDHLVASVDRFHQERVPLTHVIAVLRRLVDAGRDVSFQITASASGGRGDRGGGVRRGGSDPQLARTIDTLRSAFDDRVPMLVGALEPVGRGAVLPPGGTSADPAWPNGEPCAMAAWPVVRWDGTVVACANQRVLDGAEPPGHLTLGHIAADDWPVIRDRAVSRPELRCVRTFGPGARGCAGCRDLPRNPEAAADVRARAERPSTALVEAAVLDAQCRAGAVGFARRYGSTRHASLITLGLDETDATATATSDGRTRGALCDA